MLLLIAAASVNASPEFCAERPGLATGTCVVAIGAVQTETSLVEWGRSKQGSEVTREYSIGATRLRFGISENADLQVAFTPFNHSKTSGDGSARSVGDVFLGAKYHYFSNTKIQLAALPFIKLPVAKEPIGNRKVEFGLLMPVDILLSELWSLTLTPEMDLNANEDRGGHHARMAIAGSIGLDIADDWTVALDGLFGTERDRSTTQDAAIGVSIAHQLRPNVQLDAEADFGLTSDAPDLRLGTGFAARF